MAHRSERGLAEINEFRKSMGMTPIKMGFIECFACGNEFYSEDIDRETRCWGCRQRAEKIGDGPVWLGRGQKGRSGHK